MLLLSSSYKWGNQGTYKLITQPSCPLYEVAVQEFRLRLFTCLVITLKKKKKKVVKWRMFSSFSLASLMEMMTNAKIFITYYLLFDYFKFQSQRKALLYQERVWHRTDFKVNFLSIIHLQDNYQATTSLAFHLTSGTSTPNRVFNEFPPQT